MLFLAGRVHIWRMPQIFKLPSTVPWPLLTNTNSHSRHRCLNALIYLILLQSTKRNVRESRRNLIIRFRFLLPLCSLSLPLSFHFRCHAVSSVNFIIGTAKCSGNNNTAQDSNISLSFTWFHKILPAHYAKLQRDLRAQKWLMKLSQNLCSKFNQARKQIETIRVGKKTLNERGNL